MSATYPGLVATRSWAPGLLRFYVFVDLLLLLRIVNVADTQSDAAHANDGVFLEF